MQAMNFIQMCANGETTSDQVDEYVRAWHVSNHKIPLHTYLGMTEYEYSLWVQDGGVLEHIIHAAKESKHHGA
jgi:hypothetical protein